MRILTQNVWRFHKNPQRLSKAMALLQPDLLILSEVTPALYPYFSDLLPYRAWDEAPKDGGVCVLSRWPLENLKLWYPHQAKRRQAIEAFITTGPDRIRLLAIHPQAPLNAPSKQDHRCYLEGIQEHLYADETPTIVAGDFNMNTLSKRWKYLDPKKRLYGNTPWWQGTYPALLSPLGLALDHILIDRQLLIETAHCTPAQGSDHKGRFCVVKHDKAVLFEKNTL